MGIGHLPPTYAGRGPELSAEEQQQTWRQLSVRSELGAGGPPAGPFASQEVPAQSSPRGTSMSASSLNGPFATNQTFHDGDAPAARAPPARAHALSMLCSLAAAAVLNRGTAQFGRRNMRQDMVGPSVALDCRSFAGATRLRH